jgi:hypothetical protein
LAAGWHKTDNTGFERLPIKRHGAGYGAAIRLLGAANYQNAATQDAQADAATAIHRKLASYQM